MSSIDKSEFTPPKSSERNAGIELLRIFAMLMIVSLHTIGAQPWYGKEYGDITQIIFGCISAFCSCGVCCYAMITGFFITKSEGYNLNINRIFVLWLEILFYSISIALLFKYFGYPKGISIYLTPIINNIWWYATAYFGMIVLLPVICSAVVNLSARTLVIGSIFLYVLYSLLPVLSMRSNLWNLNGGFSALWLLCGAFFGGTVRKICDNYKLNYKKILIAFIIFNVFFMILVVLRWADRRTGFIWHLACNHISPFYVVNGGLLLLLFHQIKIKYDWLKKIILMIAPLSFSVYLIHSHPLIWEKYFCSPFIDIKGIMLPIKIAYFIFLVMAIYLACSAVDFLRRKLFDLLRVKFLAGYIDRTAHKTLDYSLEKVKIFFIKQ